jgi:glutamyl-tRNA reductase
LLEKLGLIGVSWRQGSAESLAGFALPDADAGERLAAFAREQGLEELAYLATCNRIELIFKFDTDTPARDLREPAFRLLTGRRGNPGEAPRRLRAWAGEGAAEHLFMIAAGLDSACVGETEIVGQVRDCRERARALGLAGPALELVFDAALRLAARVRGETRLGEGRVSLAEIAVEHLRERLSRTPGTVALIGVSPMTERAARSLAKDRTSLLFVNRTPARAAEAAARCGGDHMALDTFLRTPPPVEALLSATGAPGVVINGADLERLAAHTESGQAPLVIDMAIPADIDPLACEQLGIARIGMDDIVRAAEQNRDARLMQAAPAREQVDAALVQLRERFTERYYGPLLGALQRRYRQTALEGMNRLLKKELPGLGGAESEAIQRWCEVLARRFAHIPCMGLRGLLHAGPDGSIEAFLSELEPEFADELRAAIARAPGGEWTGPGEYAVPEPAAAALQGEALHGIKEHSR